MKQTSAVEWLVKELNQKIDFIPMDKWDEIRDIVQQAKAMDKEQKGYSEEDMRECWNAAYIDALAIDEETYKPLFFEDFIKQLKKEDKQ